jgi:hypothetical protein
MGLEKDVLESHREYTKDNFPLHGTPVGATVLSGDVNLNPWIAYRPDPSSRISMDDARTTHSEFPDQMPKGPASNVLSSDSFYFD